MQFWQIFGPRNELCFVPINRAVSSVDRARFCLVFLAAYAVTIPHDKTERTAHITDGKTDAAYTHSVQGTVQFFPQLIN